MPQPHFWLTLESRAGPESSIRPLHPLHDSLRDQVRNAWAASVNALAYAHHPSAPSPLPSVMSPAPEPESALSGTNPTTPVDPRTQLLADIARAFRMGMGLDDTPGSGSRPAGA